MYWLILLFFLQLTFGDSIAQSAHNQLVPVAEACGCFDVPVLPTNPKQTTGREYQTVRNMNMPIDSIAMQKQYSNMPMSGQRITRMPRSRKLVPNHVANANGLSTYNVPKTKYVKISRRNLAQINELNNLKYRLAELAKLTRLTAELLSNLPVANTRRTKNIYNGYKLPVKELPMTGTPVYRNYNVYGSHNDYITLL
ncbi:unnamed protein product [Euphydryas editha]|uniref:Uncharacterized protein n=1 Tax=Euphydryas editha TaxID=104508 RepID=A0AAU9TE61_EUPED|nr:unnamed protein product [Euphydryas editha]